MFGNPFHAFRNCFPQHPFQAAQVLEQGDGERAKSRDQIVLPILIILTLGDIERGDIR
jgi:hypothetical protein